MISKSSYCGNVVASKTTTQTNELLQAKRGPYALAMFAFEVSRDPWQMRLIGFLPSPCSESGNRFMDEAHTGQLSVVSKCTNPEGKDLWSCPSEFDSKQVLLLVKFSEELYQQRLRDGGLTVPSHLRGNVRE